MGKVHHRSLTVSLPLKNGCWKTILSYWGGLFSGANCLTSGGYPTSLNPNKRHVRNTIVANDIKYIRLMQDFVTHQQYHNICGGLWCFAVSLSHPTLHQLQLCSSSKYQLPPRELKYPTLGKAGKSSGWNGIWTCSQEGKLWYTYIYPLKIPKLPIFGRYG